MKNALFGILLAVLVGLAGTSSMRADGEDGPADASAPEAGEEASSVASSERSVTEGKALLRDIETVLSHLAEGGVLRDISADKRRAVVEAVLTELGYAPSTTAVSQATDEDEESPADSAAMRILDLRDWCLYLRISRLDDETAKALTAELRKKHRKSVRWTILDLRRLENDADSAKKSAVEMATALASREAPLVVLVGGGLQKEAKRLLDLLHLESSVVTIGDPTPRYAYDTKELSLPSGVEVTVPDFSEASASDGSKAIAPDITMSYSGHGLDPEVFEQKDEDLRQNLLRDPPIRHALDTIAAARAFAEPHF
ncbi:MAG: hypothetical protein ACOCWJ_00045 [Verrucomicrobiota bacterium]